MDKVHKTSSCNFPLLFYADIYSTVKKYFTKIIYITCWLLCFAMPLHLNLSHIQLNHLQICECVFWQMVMVLCERIEIPRRDLAADNIFTASFQIKCLTTVNLLPTHW